MNKIKNEEDSKRDEIIFKINVCKNSYRYEEMLSHLETLIKTYYNLKKKERPFLEIPIKGIIQRFQTKLRKLEELGEKKKLVIGSLSNQNLVSEETSLNLKLMDFIINQTTMYKMEERQFCEKSLKLIDILISNLTLLEDVSHYPITN